MKLFQINESDLEKLETLLPEIAQHCSTVWSPALRIKFEQVKRIVSDVRWNYGPPQSVEIIPADGEDQ